MKALLLLAAFTSLAGASASAGDCFFKDAITGYSSHSSDSIIVDANGQYLVTVSMCDDLQFAERIGFQTFDSIQVCEGDNLVEPDGGAGGEICPITSIARLTN